MALEHLADVEPDGVARPGLCWYCARPWLRVGDPPDHVLLAGFGARLVTDRCCLACNTQLNRLVDGAALNDYILAIERGRAGLADARRGSGRSRRAAPARQRASLPDGTPIVMDLRVPELIPAQLTTDSEGLVVLGGTAEQRAELVENATRKAESRGRMLDVREKYVGKQIRLQTEVDLVVWPRFAARSALGICSLLGWPDSWLSGETATTLRGWLWDAEPRALDGGRLRDRLRKPPTWAAAACPEKGHLVAFYPGRDGRAAMHVVLFGKHWFATLIDPGGNPTPRAAWRLPIDGSVEATNFHELAEEAYLRARETT